MLGKGCGLLLLCASKNILMAKDCCVNVFRVVVGTVLERDAICVLMITMTLTSLTPA